MRKFLLTAAVLIALAGCSSSSGDDASAEPTPQPSTTTSSRPSQTPSPTRTPTPTPTEEPTAHPTDLPSDVETTRDGDQVTYTLAGGELSLTLPSSWIDIVDSSQAFPVAVKNPEKTQRIVLAEIGPARLSPGVEPYRELLVDQLGVEDDQITYIGARTAGDATYPTFEVSADEYVAWIFLVTADEQLFELTVMADTYNDGVSALAHIETMVNGG